MTVWIMFAPSSLIWYFRSLDVHLSPCSGVHKLFLKKLYDPFLWMGFSCLKASELLRGDSLLFTTQFPWFPGTHLIDLGRMKGWVNLRASCGFEPGTRGLEIQRLHALQFPYVISSGKWKKMGWKYQ